MGTRLNVAIPLKYNLRNLAVRRITNAATAFTIALTVTVFEVLMALAGGLRSSLISTGYAFNVMIMRAGSQSETVNLVKRDALQAIKDLGGIARDEAGDPWVSAELIALVNLPRRAGVQGSNIIIRGLSADGPSLRPDFRMVQGRLYSSSLREVIVSERISKEFQNCGLGDKLRFGKGYWTVVGIFEAGRSVYNSEIWAGVNTLGQDFDREDYSDVVVRATDADAVARIKERVANDRRLHLKAVTEREYYDSQTQGAGPIKALGIFVSVLMAIGACFAAMNAMYAAVARRAKEIGVLRALGFSRESVLFCFIVESVLLAAVGGICGCLLALPVNGVATGTINFVTFSEVAFSFRVTPMLLLSGLIFAILMGFLGGLFPAWRAARENIIAALHSA